MSQDQQEEHPMPQGVGVTALIIAQARAAESSRPDRLFEDPFAEDFVAGAGAAFSADSEGIASLLRLRGPYIALRTRFFDDYLLDACMAGCRQVVLLAAGLDARAFRLAWPEGVELFELDLPEVLAFKERVLAARSTTPACRRVLVPTDLRGDWTKALVAAGFQADKPAAWLAEGILMYLTEVERDQLLDRIGELSAPGSQLALDQRGAAERERQALLTDQLGGDREGVMEEAKRAEAQAARLGVRIPGAQPDPSVADPEAWLTRHGWRARVYNATDRFLFYSRPVSPLLEAEAVRLWLASAEWP